MSGRPTAHWRPARCPLCDGSLLVRDDAEQVVCSACGSLLDVLPSAAGTLVRHAGQALEAVRASLEADALERALQRLRERQAAHAEVARDVLRSAGLRRWLGLSATVACAVGFGLLLTGHAGPGALLLLCGGYTLLGTLGVRRGPGWASVDGDQRSLERQAARLAGALASEIAHRERLLARLRAEQLRVGRR
jgi:hypothetical protein